MCALRREGPSIHSPVQGLGPSTAREFTTPLRSQSKSLRQVPWTAAPQFQKLDGCSTATGSGVRRITLGGFFLFLPRNRSTSVALFVHRAVVLTVLVLAVPSSLLPSLRTDCRSSSSWPIVA